MPSSLGSKGSSLAQAILEHLAMPMHSNLNLTRQLHCTSIVESVQNWSHNFAVSQDAGTFESHAQKNVYMVSFSNQENLGLQSLLNYLFYVLESPRDQGEFLNQSSDDQRNARDTELLQEVLVT